MSKLSDTQSILLVHAAQHENESLYPLPSTMAGKQLEKSIATLLKQGLVEEREVRDRSAIYRSEDDVSYGLFVTSKGLAAVNIVTGDDEPAEPRNDAPPPLPRQTKSDMVLSLLARPNGATLAELIEATGWLPHTTRAALTGLRKKGKTIDRFSRDGATCYRTTTA